LHPSSPATLAVQSSFSLLCLVEKGGTRMDIAKDSVRRLIQTKLLFTKRDVMGLILVGSDETACPLNEENSEFYKNIYVSRELETPDLPFIESIDAIETSVCFFDAQYNPRVCVDESSISAFSRALLRETS